MGTTRSPHLLASAVIAMPHQNCYCYSLRQFPRSTPEASPNCYFPLTVTETHFIFPSFLQAFHWVVSRSRLLRDREGILNLFFFVNFLFWWYTCNPFTLSGPRCCGTFAERCYAVAVWGWGGLTGWTLPNKIVRHALKTPLIIINTYERWIWQFWLFDRTLTDSLTTFADMDRA